MKPIIEFSIYGEGAERRILTSHAVTEVLQLSRRELLILSETMEMEAHRLRMMAEEKP